MMPSDTIAAEIKSAQKDLDVATLGEAEAHSRTVAFRQRLADLKAIQAVISTPTTGKPNA
jgi:hypothetical protein